MLIARPTETFKDYVRATGELDSVSWELGRMSMALEVITQIQILQDIAVMDDGPRAQAVTALTTLLQDCGIEEPAFKMYERLGQWRLKRFVAEPEPSPPAIAVVDGQLSMDLSSSLVSHELPPGGRGRLRALPTEHRGRDEAPTDGPVA